ncbi:helix-turn-helix domain-containing protein [Mycobacterium malmoense]|uniref:helix-turn-helix domain-containing protein n=1 Tax=Mycobacterium malmoense TaxID=1780 RepID=UPI0009F34170|nr:helix-turn-helix transcriptional regulator [Mycobacterium malmoense]QZA17306.1 helix-turn-helix domain-containing protein [Mycobacterium malmoense]UNB94095.1 helix-turn-helix transcriptional regulator [Mycobacterium malmoense]
MVDPAFRRRHFAEVPESAIERELALALGRKLAELRQQRGLTQEFVAQSAGISRNHYQLLEYGLGQRSNRRPANPRLSTLVALSEVLGTTVPELIGAMFPPGRSTEENR